MRANKHAFYTRGLVSFLMVANFLISTVSGLVLYVTPQGRIAFWTDWRLIGLTKTAWGNLHLFTGLIFVVAGIVHLYFNWKPLMHYLYSKATHHLNLRREMIVAGIIVVLTVTASVLEIPPVSYVFDLNERIKTSWIRTPADEPPYGHAEESSVRAMVRRLGLDERATVDALGRAGVVVGDATASLADVAVANGINPAEVYRLMTDSRPAEQPTQRAAPPEERLEALQGRGLGRLTVSRTAELLGIDAEQARRNLSAHEIDCSADEKLKQIGERHDLTPLDVARAML